METGTVAQRSLYWDLFNGIDFVSEISFCETQFVDDKMLILAIWRGWMTGKEIM